MSSQGAPEIPFNASHQRQAFKLLELPTELLELLESDSPPTLQLKSAVSSTSSTTPAYAVLCSPYKTYRLQQKSSSNPIIILQPSSTSVSWGQDDDVATTPRASICNIATIEDTLELYAQETEDAAPLRKNNRWHEKFAKGRSKGTQ
ncbi:MAG: hypothetical protein M1818_004268 [Claussenomyces sp. TS43310]|nr:MAG: hypothetical protein M1818_004268 [Claussenomyces sp. TS43310]